MAAIDYGALLKVNGEFINRNKGLFMDISNTGYIIEKAKYLDATIYDGDIDIRGNFYVYAGDRDLLLAFYKGYFLVISNGLILKSISSVPFLAERFYIGNTSINVSHLEPDLQTEQDDAEIWKEYVRNNWIDKSGDERICELVGGRREYELFLRHIKSHKRSTYKYRTDRWIAEWEHNSNKYEVIFGSGIDPDENVWNEIKHESYGFTKREIEVIDGWFSE